MVRASVPYFVRVKRIATSGWVPAGLVYLVVVWLLRDVANVGIRHTLAFTVWAGWTLTVPGTVVWRAVLDRRRGGSRGRPLLEDAVLGTALGTVLLVPLYLLSVGVGAPLLHLAWPLAAVALVGATARGRQAMLRPILRSHRPWWNWATALLLLLILWHLGHDVLAPRRLDALAYRTMYVDMPFHISLTTDFKHHAIADFPFVAGTTLKYHWLVYPLFAAASWGSGVEAAVIVLILGPLALALLSLLTTGMAVSRLARHRSSALIGMALLAFLTPWDGFGWTPWRKPLDSARWVLFESPTTMLAAALTALTLVLVLGVLRRQVGGPVGWTLLGVTMLATAGAKSTVLPPLIGALVGTTLVLWLLRRAFPRRLAALSAMSLGAFGLATLIFYGPGTRSLTVAPFQLVDQAAEVSGSLTGGSPAPLLRAGILLAGVLAYVLLGATTVGLFVLGGWRRPAGWLVVGFCSAAYLLATTLAHPSLSELYFVWAMTPVLAIGGALGADRLWADPARLHLLSGAVAALAGLATVIAVAPLTSSLPPETAAPTEVGRAWVSWIWPVLALLLCIAAVAVAVKRLSRRASTLRGQSIWVTAMFALGMCLLGPLGQYQMVLTTPAVAPQRDAETIGQGGVAAARWLREHSSSGDLIATNLHDRRPTSVPVDHRQFWVSAFTERRILVEGWAYIPPELVGLPSNKKTNASTGGPFWKPAVLAANDRAFTHPTAQSVATLHLEYGVTWLFVDRQRPVDLTALSRYARHVHGSSRYQVFRLLNLG